jgi:hypothetical protein
VLTGRPSTHIATGDDPSMPSTPSTHLRRRVVGLAAVPALLLTAAACGGDDDDGESGGGGGGDSAAFCEDARDVTSRIAELDPTDEEAFDEALDSIRGLEPPDELADDWNTLVDAFERIAEMTPEEQANVDQDEFAEAEESSERVGTYLEEECGIDE